MQRTNLGTRGDRLVEQNRSGGVLAASSKELTLEGLRAEYIESG